MKTYEITYLNNVDKRCTELKIAESAIEAERVFHREHGTNDRIVGIKIIE
jgi:hypothetical protein